MSKIATLKSDLNFFSNSINNELQGMKDINLAYNVKDIPINADDYGTYHVDADILEKYARDGRITLEKAASNLKDYIKEETGKRVGNEDISFTLKHVLSPDELDDILDSKELDKILENVESKTDQYLTLVDNGYKLAYYTK